MRKRNSQKKLCFKKILINWKWLIIKQINKIEAPDKKGIFKIGGRIPKEEFVINSMSVISGL